MNGHEWERFYPRGTWPVYRCTVCRMQKCPTREELNSSNPPAWFDSACEPPKPLTADDIAWLTGTGRFAQ